MEPASQTSGVSIKESVLVYGALLAFLFIFVLGWLVLFAVVALMAGVAYGYSFSAVFTMLAVVSIPLSLALSAYSFHYALGADYRLFEIAPFSPDGKRLELSRPLALRVWWAFVWRSAGVLAVLGIAASQFFDIELKRLTVTDELIVLTVLYGLFHHVLNRRYHGFTLSAVPQQPDEPLPLKSRIRPSEDVPGDPGSGNPLVD